MVNLSEKPFYLSEIDCRWVIDTIAAMNPEEKVGQLFFGISASYKEDYLKDLITRYHLGGCRYQAAPGLVVHRHNELLQQFSRIPLFIACNTEAGGEACTDGSYLGSGIKIYRQYPGNWNSIMIVNLSAYIFYILALIFPEAVWLGIATMMFNLFQLLGHGIEMNVKLKTWYNPGLVTSLFLFTPISIFYFYTIVVSGIVCGWDWICGIGMLFLILILTVILPVQCLKKKDSPYLIPEEQVEQFEKVKDFAKIWK